MDSNKFPTPEEFRQYCAKSARAESLLDREAFAVGNSEAYAALHAELERVTKLCDASLEFQRLYQHQLAQAREGNVQLQQQLDAANKKNKKLVDWTTELHNELKQLDAANKRIEEILEVSNTRHEMILTLNKRVAELTTAHSNCHMMADENEKTYHKVLATITRLEVTLRELRKADLSYWANEVIDAALSGDE
jgi:small-conductance mechanosensitive channel